MRRSFAIFILGTFHRKLRLFVFFFRRLPLPPDGCIYTYLIFYFIFFEKLLDDWGLGRSARLIISHMAKQKKNETLAHRGVHRLEGFSRYHQQTTTNLHCECVRAKMNKFDIDDFLFYSLFFKKWFTYSRQRNCKFKKNEINFDWMNFLTPVRDCRSTLFFFIIIKEEKKNTNLRLYFFPGVKVEECRRRIYVYLIKYNERS